MNPPRGTAPRHVRKRVLVDSAVQGGLLAALLALEILLVVAALWLVHARMAGAIEETLYRVHVAHAEPLLGRLAREAWMIGGLFLAVNLTALLIAEGIWRSHVNAVLRELELHASAVAALDFASPIDETQRHEVLRLAATWRRRERDRLRMIRDGARGLEALGSRTDVNTEGVRKVLHEMAALLPRSSGQSAPPARESSSAHGDR